MEGYADGMWMDFWVLPMIVEAERGNSLPAWLKEYNKEGTYNLPLKTLIGADPYPNAPESSGNLGLAGEALLMQGSLPHHVRPDGVQMTGSWVMQAARSSISKLSFGLRCKTLSLIRANHTDPEMPAE